MLGKVRLLSSQDRGRGILIETNFFVHIITHNIQKQDLIHKPLVDFMYAKVYQKCSVVSSLNNAFPHPELALTHVSSC